MKIKIGIVVIDGDDFSHPFKGINGDSVVEGDNDLATWSNFLTPTHSLKGLTYRRCSRL